MRKRSPAGDGAGSSPSSPATAWRPVTRLACAAGDGADAASPVVGAGAGSAGSSWRRLIARAVLTAIPPMNALISPSTR